MSLDLQDYWSKVGGQITVDNLPDFFTEADYARLDSETYKAIDQAAVPLTARQRQTWGAVRAQHADAAASLRRAMSPAARAFYQRRSERPPIIPEVTSGAGEQAQEALQEAVNQVPLLVHDAISYEAIRASSDSAGQWGALTAVLTLATLLATLVGVFLTAGASMWTAALLPVAAGLLAATGMVIFFKVGRRKRDQ